MDNLNEQEKLRTMARGLLALMNWLHESSAKSHVIDPSGLRAPYNDTYIADMREAHAAYEIASRITC